MKTTGISGHIALGEEVGGALLTMFILDYVFEGNGRAYDLAHELLDDEGNCPPVDEMVTYVLIESGRLLAA
jgi:hypothetical protein